MTCMSEEKGTISFTQTGYMDVMRQIRKSYNDHINDVYAAALALHAKLAAMSGGKVSEKRKALFKDHVTDFRFYWGYNDKVVCDDYDLCQLVQTEMFRGANGKLTKPRRSAFPKLTNKIASFVFYCGTEGSVSLNEKTNSIRWEVDENNHAVEHARNSILGGRFIGILHKYKWRRNEGGVWYYMDEFSRESDGNAEYESEFWGPVGKKRQEDNMKALRARFR